VRVKWIVLAALLATTEVAWSLETYCDSDSVRLYNGGHFEKKWSVTHATARRVQLPGQKEPTKWCSISFGSVGGMYRPIEIVQPPKVGQAKVTNTYRVLYQSAKPGPDELTIKVHWIGRTGALQEATVHYSIQVVDKPLG
jgi:hypothetical protein